MQHGDTLPKVLSTGAVRRRSRRIPRVAAARLVATACATLLSTAASAQKPSDEPVPSCLDQSIRDELGAQIRPRGVQKRPFLKKGQFVLDAHGGLFAGDQVSSSYLYGGGLAFYFSEDLAFEARFDVTRVQLELDGPVAEFFGDDRFEAGAGYLALANLVWSPIHAKMKIGDGIVPADFMIAAGGGRLFHDSVQGVTFDAGAIFDFFITQWVTLRIDVRDVITIQEAVAETRLTNNLVLTGGLTLWLPTWHGY